MKRFLCLIAICLGSLPFLFAQETVQIYLAPDAAQISIDGQVYEPGISLKTELPIGSYTIKLINPKYQTIVDTIEVLQEKANVFRFSFKRLSVDFEAYQEEKKAYISTKSKLWFGNVILPIANLGGFIYAADLRANAELQKIEDQATVLSTSYQFAINPDQALSIELNYRKLQDQHRLRRREMLWRRGIGIPLFLGTSYFCYRVLKKANTKDLKKPVWQPEESISIQQLDIQPSADGLVLNVKITF